jgi:hypothetical protein
VPCEGRQQENQGDAMRTKGHFHGSVPGLKQAKAFWNAHLILFILVYSLVIPKQSLAKFTPLATGYLSFENGINADRVKMSLATPTTAACPQASCAFLPLLSSSLPVRIVEAGYQRTRADTYWYFGDITTLYGYPLYNVKIKFRAYDPAGQLKGEHTGPTIFPATLPGQLNPFDIKTNITDSLHTGRVEFLIAGFDLYSPIVYAPATVITTTEVQFPSTIVYAQIRNDGSAPLSDVKAYAWSTLGWSNPWGENYLEKVADILLPGETITFTKIFYDNEFPSSIRVAAQGILQP